MKDTLIQETVIQTIIAVWKEELIKGNAQDVMDLLGGQRPVKDNRIVHEIVNRVAESLQGNQTPDNQYKAENLVENTLQEILTTANDSQHPLSVKTILQKLLQDKAVAEKYTLKELMDKMNPQGGGGGFFSGLVNKLDETVTQHKATEDNKA